MAREKPAEVYFCPHSGHRFSNSTQFRKHLLALEQLAGKQLFERRPQDSGGVPGGFNRAKFLNPPKEVRLGCALDSLRAVRVVSEAEACLRAGHPLSGVLETQELY